MLSPTSSEAEFGLKILSSYLVSSFKMLVPIPVIVAIKKMVAPTAVRLTIANSLTNSFD